MPLSLHLYHAMIYRVSSGGFRQPRGERNPHPASSAVRTNLVLVVRHLTPSQNLQIFKSPIELRGKRSLFGPTKVSLEARWDAECQNGSLRALICRICIFVPQTWAN
jgi:hypothetical protein